ncbi:serine hydrolase domain-containing protein [Rubinisphaera italica]|uniref:Esterase EstB n=1 Tax=Rubinisphaera italica TaxID=2527969 RepID=A0A5C5XKJ4_9PLAN|nr:serine hydrolase domain-containing protein [Rubinisphaera italica]TWT62262.1 Esterase EstB [Rubinisphaera italica]
MTRFSTSCLSLIWFCLLAVFLTSSLNAEQPGNSPDNSEQFAAIDEAIAEFQKLIGCDAVTIAISRNGKMIYSKGYGWKDTEHTIETPADALMRIASVSKSITSSAIKTLIRDGKLSLDDKIFDLLELSEPRKKEFDPRWRDVTVAHLLKHEGGWDRDETFDPMFRAREVEQQYRLRGKAQPEDMIRFMLAKPLQFDPGSRSSYSNFGYCLLGRVVEKASGMPYQKYVQEKLFDPLGIKDIQQGRDRPRDWDPREVEYPIKTLRVEVMDSHGGLIASAPALCKYMEQYWLDGKLRNPQRYYWTYFGSLPGTTAMALQRIDGFNVVVLCNGRRDESYNEDNQFLNSSIESAVDEIAKSKYGF